MESRIYKVMKDLKNTSGLAWNEETQIVDAEDSVWDDLLKRREFKNAKMYKRSPFQYFNELAIIVGNDIAEGFVTTMPLDVEEEHPMNDAFHVLDEDDTNCGTPIDNQPDFDEELYHSNQSSPSARGTPPPSSSRRGKRKKTSLSTSLDVICKTMKELKDGLSKPQIVKVDKSKEDNVLSAAYTALKAIPKLSRAVFVKAHDTFVLQCERAKGFLMMDEAERVD